MDLQSWEKVLLEWVHNFGFTKTNYIALELTDIDAFFAYYVQKAQVEPVPVVEVALQAQPTHHLSPDEPFSGQLTPLQAFLREIYPEFNGHIDGQGRLVGSDYLYVYSLLLHYKCVKQPSASFHSVCKKLPALTQSSICEFFQQTMNRPLTRESLRQAIANVSRVVQTSGAAENKACRATSSLSLDSDGSGHCSSLGDDAQDLPIDFIGPMSSPSPKAMPPPATPKTELLEQRTREVRGLQAQLEAERYEKNVLEEQILENEHLIKSLRKENKVKKMQLAKLKDSDDNEDEDSIRKYVPNEFDHLKCSLMKEISQKEALITETRDKLQDLRIENSELLGKVKISSEQLVVCMDRIRDLEVRQEELSQALSTKSDQIISLERDKQELEKCLQVTRDELHNRREVLNSSSDLLDLPMSMSPNTTPENLADSVIDKQLREKEHENLELKEELQKTSKALLDLLEEHGLSTSPSSVSEEPSSQLWATVCLVKEELTKSVRLSEQRESELQEKSQQLDGALAQFAKLLEKGREHSRELDEINAKYEQMLCSHLSSKQELQSHNDRLLQSLSQANDKSAEADEHLRTIKLQLAEKEQQMDQLGSELMELRDKNKTLESRTNSLITERNSGVFQLHQEQRRQEYVRSKYAQCREQLVAQTSDMSRLSSHLDASDWAGTLRRIDEVIAAREELRQQHEALKQESQELKERLQLQQEQQADLQQQLLRENEQMETMRQDHQQHVDQIQTDLNSQLLSSQQEMESFLARITVLLNGGISVKSEDSCQFKEFESLLSFSLRQQSQEVATLQATADQLREQLGAAQRQHNSMIQKESQERAARMAQLMRLTHSLEASAAKIRSSLDGKDAEIAAGQQQVAKMQEQLASDQASSLMLKQLNDTINNLEQVNEKLIDDNSKLQNLHMDISASLSSVTGEVERLTNELSKCQASLAEISASDRLKATQLSASAKEQQQLQGQLVEMMGKKSQLEEQVEQLRSLKSEFEERCQELERQLAEKESQVSRLNSQHKDELEAIKAKLKDAQFKVEQQRQAILTEREEISKYRTQLAELSKARDQGGDEMAKLRVLLSQSERDNQEHLKTIEDLQGMEHQHAQQVEKLTREHSEELLRLQGLLTDEEEVTAQLRTQLVSATELAEARTRQQTELVASLQHEKEMMEQLRAEAEKLEKLRESQNARERQHEEEMAKLRGLLSQGERDNQEHLKTIEDLHGKGQLLAQQMEEMIGQHSEELHTLQALLTDEQEVTAQLRTELAEAGTRQQSLAELAETELLASLQHEKAMVEQLRAEAEKLKELRETQDHRERQNEEKMAKLRLLSSQGERDNQEHLKTIQDLQGKGKELSDQMEKLTREHSEELLRLQALLSDEQEVTAQLRTELAGATELVQAKASQQTQAELVQTELLASLQHEKAMMEQLRAEAEKLKELREIQDHRERHNEEEMAKLRVLLSQGERDNQEHLKTIEDLQGQGQLLAEQMEKLTREHSKELRRLQALLLDEQEVTAQLRTELAGATELVQAKASQQTQAELAQTELLASLQHEKAMVEQLRVEAEEKSAAAYERIGKLEKLREAQDHRARKLSDQLAEAEKVKVSLNLEIGGLNSDIEQRKRQMAEQAQELFAAQNVVAELQSRLKSEVEGRNQARKELEKITSKLAEVQQELNSTRLLHETQHFELDEKTREIELERAQSADRVHRCQRRIESLEGQLAEVQAASQAQSQAPTDLCTTYSKEECAATASDDELAQLRQENARSKLDCQILQAKYRETKDEIQRCEQKMKDQRLEMEGKLDKMKTKMRSLYTAEVTRMKEKQERDAATNKAELEALAAQNVKYEEHTRKLSNQIVRLNEKILEQKKQNAIISTKLSHLQMQPLSVPKTSAPAPLVTVPAGSSATNDDWQPFKRPSAPSSNLAMEDEEGEVFNNTYLTDLKLGRVPDITAEEINYRNSLQPPHLKSTYAAQYDLSSQDEDLKDGPHSLDDSMCALLSSTGTGTRKKSIGTHYKRPGPPTPSKNGGRLSFGSSEPPREVLREFGDHNNTSKTPARFKFLTTRFSVGSSGLPRDELPQRKRSSILTRLQRRRLQRQVAGVFCTSTPRKSRSYYDQQRLIGASDAVFSDEEEIKAADQQTTPHLSNGALLALTQGTTRRITHTPKRTARVPLYLHGNVLAKSRSEGLKVGISGERMRQRRKMCQERMARFDQDRPLDQVRLSDRLSYSGRPSQLLMGNTVVLDDGTGRRSIVGLTFKVDDSWQLQHQQFEADNVSQWTLDNEDSEMEDWRFEELCKQRGCTAPFQVQPAVAMDSLSVRCGTLFRTISFGQRVATVVLGLSVAVALLSLLVEFVRARV